MQAFGELYRRHAEAAWRVALAVTGNRDDASDAVAEAFSRVLRAIPARRLEQAGRFRPYLLSATRNAGVDILRRKGRLTLSDPTIGPEPAAPTPGPWEELEAGEDAGMVGTAFRSLPERWRSVLWLTEVEGIPAREAGELLGLSANGVAQLAVRARAGLRQRYLQAHLRADAISEGCRPAVSLLGAYVAGALSTRETARVARHLAACSACRARVAELEDLGPALRRILIPLPVGLAEVARAHFGLGATGMGTPHASTALSRVLRIGQSAHRPLASASAGMLAIGLAGAALAIYRGPAGPGTALPPGPSAPGGPGSSAQPPSLTRATSPGHGGAPSTRSPRSPGSSAGGSPSTQTPPGAASSSPSRPGTGSPATPSSTTSASASTGASPPSAGTTASTSGAGSSSSLSPGSAPTSSSGSPGGGAGTSGGAPAPAPTTPASGAQVNAQVGPVSASVGVSVSSAPGPVAQVNGQVGPVSASVGVGAGSCTGVAVGSVSVGCSGAGSSGSAGTGQTSAQSSVPVSATATVGPPVSSAVGAVTTTVSQAGAQLSDTTAAVGSALNQLGPSGG
jgi:RNA polymerase sigma factor (sigma-70 family)